MPPAPPLRAVRRFGAAVPAAARRVLAGAELAVRGFFEQMGQFSAKRL
ncbi:hypothetical protein [Conexibacter sp. SYSU D00693]|nr:hypothetical protein [Conexibacter sp. SYSU D00693]